MSLIDYDDMQLFKGASVPERTDSDKYAVMLQYPKRKIGKFCITTEDDIRNSITALSELTLPQEIEDPARHYIKQAALHFGIDANWESKECSRIVDMSEVELHKTAEEDVEYNIKIGENIFSLDSPTAVKLAEEYFLGNIDFMSIDERNKIASVICKEGAMFPEFLPLQQTVGYAHPTISNHQKEFDYRRKVASDPKYIEALEKLAETVGITPPITFLDRVRTIDKVAAINPELHGHPYSRFFDKEFDHDNDLDIEKLAFLTNIASDETAVDKLSKIL